MLKSFSPKFAFLFNKRVKIIVSSGLLTLGLLGSQFVPVYFIYQFIAGLAVAALMLSIWVLWEGLNILKAALLMLLPMLFTLAVASYFLLIPAEWLKILVALVFGLVFYILLLSQNIFNVSSLRTIPLYRVASTTVFVLTIFTASLLFVVIYSFHFPFYINGPAVFLLSFFLILPIMWSVQMEKLNQLIVFYSVILALIVGEVGLVLSFWPLTNAMSSVVLALVLYMVLGISTDTLRERLSKEAVLGYIKWSIPIFLIAALTASWV